MHNPMTTRVRMHDSGLFGQDSAFWRWICTGEAVPYIVAFRYSSHQEGTPRLLDPNHRAQLAKRHRSRIRQQALFGEASPVSRPWRSARRSSAFSHERVTFVRLLDQLVDLHGGLLPQAGAA